MIAQSRFLGKWGVACLVIETLVMVIPFPTYHTEDTKAWQSQRKLSGC